MTEEEREVENLLLHMVETYEMLRARKNHELFLF